MVEWPDADSGLVRVMNREVGVVSCKVLVCEVREIGVYWLRVRDWSPPPERQEGKNVLS